VDPKHLPIDFRHLETFCRVAELKNFSKAADELYLTQPTVSGHILFLEKILGLRLFDRTGRQALLTKAGNILYLHASKMLASRKDALNALSEFSEGIRGDLVLGASTIPGEYLLPRLLGDFRKEYPGFSLSLKVGDTKEVVQYVLQCVVEFGITGAKLIHPSLQYDFFGDDEIITIGPPNAHRDRRPRIKLEEMVNLPWVLREEGSGTRMAVEKALRRKGKSLKHFVERIEMGSTASLKEGVKAGLGFAFISKVAAEEELRRGMLSQVAVEGLEPISRPFYLALRRGKTLSPIGLKFLRYLKKRKEG
jgi:DNA-binding transcriptional LysR family regulator